MSTQTHPNPLRFEIKNFKDVSYFLNYLFSCGINFHPDKDFDEYLGADQNPVFDETQIGNLDDSLEDVWNLCLKTDVDIYSIAIYAWDTYVANPAN